MKKTILSLLMLCMGVTMQAQVSESGQWYNGWLCYSAKNMAAGKVLMNAMAEGEEHEFMLVPVPGEKDTYRVTDGPHDYVNEYNSISTVRHMKKDGWDLLCFYNSNNQLTSVMSNEQGEAQDISIVKFKNQLVGEYELVTNDSDDELKLEIQWDQVSVNLELATYKVEDFNGIVLGYITIPPIEGSTNRLEGTWEVIPTKDGIKLYRLRQDEESFLWARDGINYTFRWAETGSPRFSYASSCLLNDKKFAKMDKSDLRTMRNEILATHGYRFQSADLQDYFSKKPWYLPAASNDDVKPSLIERLNIELIRAVELND